MQTFCGKTVFVTGAGSGLGYAIAVAFAHAGAHVYANDLASQPGIHRLQQEIAALGGSCSLKLGDVSDPQQVRAFFDDISQLDVMVNNAGFLQEVAITEMSDQDWERMLKVHLFGSFYFCRAAARNMLSSGNGGRIINIASDLGQLGCELLAHYSAAKGGVIALTKSLARELAAHGIRVNAIAPGAILTPMVERLGAEYVASEAAKYPLQRLGSAAEIASVALFLASDDSSFMTGQVLGVNGGGVMVG